MAVSKNQTSAKLMIQVKISEENEKQRTLNNLNPTAADEDVYAVAMALGALQKHEVLGIKRQDVTELVSE